MSGKRKSVPERLLQFCLDLMSGEADIVEETIVEEPIGRDVRWAHEVPRRLGRHVFVTWRILRAFTLDPTQEFP